jgi:hypothetical protein
MVSGAATFKGATVTRMPLYKVDGNYWAVTFNTNIGDVPALVASPTKYLTSGTTVSTYDNVVRGVEPTSSILNNLLTGVQYSARMQSYTRGPFGGYSDFSNAEAPAVPSGPPPLLLGFQAVEVREVTEVQEVAVYASRLTEIQTITTSAEAYASSQEFILKAPVGQPIVGNFALRFAEVQTVVMTADFANVVQGSFQLLYSYFDYSSSVTAKVERTACLDVSSTAEQVQAALQGLPHIDTVEVVRSGYGGYTDFFGFSWSVTFTGNLVAGNVQPLVVLYGNEGSGTCTNSQPTGLHFAASTTNENRAVGIDTEVQQITLTSTDHVVEGAYKLNFASTGPGTKSTACLSWDATAMDMQLALLSGIQSIDEVLVERSGSGTSLSNFGYVYNIFFTGNAMHARGTSGGALPLLTYVQGGCTPLAHVVDGVVTALTSLEASVNSTRLRAQGYHLAATSTSTDQLLLQLAIMPLFVNINNVQRSLSDDNTGYQFTVNFDLSMGRAPVMVCGMDVALTAVPATCSHFTLLEGNFCDLYVDSLTYAFGWSPFLCRIRFCDTPRCNLF